MMKKFFAVVLVAMAVAMPSKAQFSYGLQAGINMSNVSTVDANDLAGTVKSRTGFFVGPTIKFTLPLIGLGFDAAALYDQREGEVEGQTLKSQSVQIPINLRYGFGAGSMAEIFAFAGPQFGFNVGSNKNLDTASEWTLKSSNLSANVGLGATLLSKLQLKFNYNFALGKTGEVEMTTAGVKKTLGGAKFNSWQLSLAYFF
jgi:hypothetical protein